MCADFFLVGYAFFFCFHLDTEATQDVFAGDEKKNIWKWKIKFDIIFAWQPNARPQNLTALHPTTNFCLSKLLRCHNNGNVFRDMAANVSATDEVFVLSFDWGRKFNFVAISSVPKRARSVQVVQLRPVSRRQSWALVWMALWNLSWWLVWLMKKMITMI